MAAQQLIAIAGPRCRRHSPANFQSSSFNRSTIHFARQWVAAQFRQQAEIRLIVDRTKIGFQHQLLIVCLAYRKCTIPPAWTWVRHVRGHSTAGKQLVLLAYVRQLLPKGAGVFLVGDFEYLSNRFSLHRKAFDQRAFR